MIGTVPKYTSVKRKKKMRPTPNDPAGFDNLPLCLYMLVGRQLMVQKVITESNLLML